MSALRLCFGRYVQPRVSNGTLFQLNVVRFPWTTELEEFSPDALRVNFSVSAIIGPPFSITSIPVQHITREFGVPQVSYWASAPSLSNKSQYPTFARLIASDSLQGPALARAVQRFGWKKVAILRASDDYAVQLTNSAEEELYRLGVQVLTLQMFTTATNQNFNAQLHAIKQSKARIILLISLVGDAANVFSQAAKFGMLEPPYVWLGTEAWIDHNSWNGLWNIMYRAMGFIGMLPHLDVSNQVYKMLEEKWFDSYQRNFNSTTYTQQPNVFDVLAYDSVYLVARALHDHLHVHRQCDHAKDEEKACILPYSTLLKQSFMGASGWVQLTETGDRLATLDIVNIQINPVLYDILGFYPKAMTPEIVEIAQRVGKPPLISVPIGVVPAEGQIILSLSKAVWPDGTNQVPTDSPDIFDPVEQVCGFTAVSITPSLGGFKIGLSIAGMLTIMCIVLVHLSNKKWKSVRKLKMLTPPVRISTHDKLRLASTVLSCIQLCALVVAVEYAFGNENLLWISKIKDVFSFFFIETSILDRSVYWISLWCCVALSFVFFLYLAVFYLRLDYFVPKVIMNAFPILGSVLGTVFFIPNLSTLLSVFRCLEESHNRSFLTHDCQTWCWEGEHIVAIIGSTTAILLYLPFSLWARPVWQELNDNAKLKSLPENVVLSASVKLMLVLNYSFLEPLHTVSAIFQFLCLFSMLLWVIIKRPFNVAKVNLYLIAEWAFPTVAAFFVFIDVLIAQGEDTFSSFLSDKDPSETTVWSYAMSRLRLSSWGEITISQIDQSSVQDDASIHGILVSLLLITWFFMIIAFFLFDRRYYRHNIIYGDNSANKRTNLLVQLLGHQSSRMVSTPILQKAYTARIHPTNERNYVSPKECQTEHKIVKNAYHIHLIQDINSHQNATIDKPLVCKDESVMQSERKQSFVQSQKEDIEFAKHRLPDLNQSTSIDLMGNQSLGLHLDTKEVNEIQYHDGEESGQNEEIICAKVGICNEDNQTKVEERLIGASEEKKDKKKDEQSKQVATKQPSKIHVKTITEGTLDSLSEIKRSPENVSDHLTYAQRKTPPIITLSSLPKKYDVPYRKRFIHKAFEKSLDPTQSKLSTKQEQSERKVRKTAACALESNRIKTTHWSSFRSYGKRMNSFGSFNKVDSKFNNCFLDQVERRMQSTIFDEDEKES